MELRCCSCSFQILDRFEAGQVIDVQLAIAMHVTQDLLREADSDWCLLGVSFLSEHHLESWRSKRSVC